MEILNERETTHGAFVNVSQTARALKHIFHQRQFSDEMVEALDMIATKLARIVEGDPNMLDHWEDIAGYATLAARSIPIPIVKMRPLPPAPTLAETITDEGIANIAIKFGLGGTP